MDPLIVGTVHWVHVFLGVFWFGTILYTRVILFPLMGSVPAEHVKPIREAMVGDPAARRWTYIFSYGTVIWDTALQQVIPPNKLARVSAYNWMGAMAFLPAGYAIAGPVAGVDRACRQPC